MRLTVLVTVLLTVLTTACSGGAAPHVGSVSTVRSTSTSPSTATSGSATDARPAGTDATASPTGAARSTVGTPGVGDPYFPLEGNGGYDVSHYDLNLSYTPTGHHLAGTTTVIATATQDLTRFDLDLSGMTVSAVAVDGALARFTRAGQELQISPAIELRRGREFSVAVTYAGSPATIVGSPIVFGAPYGWIYTPDGAFVGDEPDAARTWFPSNDHPSDKATFTFRITVPSGLEVIANGDHEPFPDVLGATNTFVWNETSPMATYLATIDIGRWDIREGRTPGGIRELVANDPSLAGKVAADRDFALTGRITDYWATMFGPYPFTSTGAIIDSVHDIGFSLETQTRPLYGFAPDPVTVAHELAHEWFGDSVSVRTWRDIWLNEGFATFAQTLWIEHTGGPSTWIQAQRIFDQYPAGSTFWNRSIADPQRDKTFSSAVYARGDLTLAALRHRIGDHRFFALLQAWTAAHHFGNATTSEFIALADQVCGQSLDHFFQTWLDTRTRPAALTAG